MPVPHHFIYGACASMECGIHRGPETHPLWIPRGDCNHILFIHAYVDAHLGRFHPLATVDNAAMSTGVRVSVSVPAFSTLGCIPEVELLCHMVNSTDNFLRNHHTAFCSGCAI